jgi:hypothetical protein
MRAPGTWDEHEALPAGVDTMNLFLARSFVCAAGVAFANLALAADPEAPQAPATFDEDAAHGYLSLGLVAAGSTLSSPPFPDIDASGGGIAVHGVAHSAQVNPSLDIAFSGQFALMSREFDGSGSEVADALYEIDGGLRLSDLLYVSLGYSSQAMAFDNADVVLNYAVVPVGVALLSTGESGYVLAQLRAGGGRLSNDQNDDTESVGYLGLRAAVQRGFGSSVQFMLGLGWDRYDFSDIDQTEDFLRLELGLGFGL